MASKKRQTKVDLKAQTSQKKKQGKGDKQDESVNDLSLSKNIEEDKSEDEISVLGEEEDHHMNDILNKYGFKHQVELDMMLPSGEREVIHNYLMTFLDRNYQAKANLELGIGENKGSNMIDNPAFPKPKDLNDSNPDYECTLSDVIIYLKKCGYPLENCFVSYQSPIFSAYINCGLDPLPTSIKITKEDLIYQKSENEDKFKLEFKFQWGIRSEYKNDDEGMAAENAKDEILTQSGRTQRRAATMTQHSQQDKEHKRTKERTIGYIIEKVSQWRKLYNGYMDENHQLRRMSLEDAAAKVQVSKKSLDDYLSQLRQGRALGFNFNQHKDEKVGYLRQFVKENSAKNQKSIKKEALPQMSQPDLSRKGSKKSGRK